MGRRTTNTTKGGKFMNPTDQARKEARRRELKKNKKQRIAVRQAVIKTKDPQQMIKELEDLDNMELDPTSETHYNEKVIKDKRRKLLETLIRIVDFYFKEDPSRGRDFKTMIETYKLNRAKKEMYYESVKNAQTVEINTIPLPEAPFETPQLNDIPLPGIKPHSILKKVPPGPPTGLPPNMQMEKKPPGHPPGPPPSKKIFGKGPTSVNRPGNDKFSEKDENNDEDPYDPEEGPELMEEDARYNLPPDLDDDDEEFHHRDDEDDGMFDVGNDSDDGNTNMEKKRSVRFADDEGDEDEEEARPHVSSTVTPLQAMMLKMAGQSIPAPPQAGPSNDYDHDEAYDDNERRQPDDDDVREATHQPKPPGPPPGLPPGPPPGMPPGIMQRPPGVMPPGPPPGRPPTMLPNMAPRPGDVPRMMNRLDTEGRLPPDHRMQMMQNPNILSAPPSLIHRPSEKEVDEAQAATIVAKPKLTSNPKVDSTRFMPTSLRIRREVKGRSGKAPAETSSSSFADKQKMEKKKKQELNTADAAYDSFMKEMQGLL